MFSNPFRSAECMVCLVPQVMQYNPAGHASNGMITAGVVVSQHAWVQDLALQQACCDLQTDRSPMLANRFDYVGGSMPHEFCSHQGMPHMR